MGVITLYKDTSPFLIPNNDDIYRTSSAFASPSAGGALICIPTPSGVMSENISCLCSLHTVTYSYKLL